MVRRRPKNASSDGRSGKKNGGSPNFLGGPPSSRFLQPPSGEGGRGMTKLLERGGSPAPSQNLFTLSFNAMFGLAKVLGESGRRHSSTSNTPDLKGVSPREKGPLDKFLSPFASAPNKDHRRKSMETLDESDAVAVQNKACKITCRPFFYQLFMSWLIFI